MFFWLYDSSRKCRFQLVQKRLFPSFQKTSNPPFCPTFRKLRQRRRILLQSLHFLALTSKEVNEYRQYLPLRRLCSRGSRMTDSSRPRRSSIGEPIRPRRSLSLGMIRPRSLNIYPFLLRTFFVVKSIHAEGNVCWPEIMSNETMDAQMNFANRVQTPREENKRRFSREENRIPESPSSPHLTKLSSTLKRFGVNSPCSSSTLGVLTVGPLGISVFIITIPPMMISSVPDLIFSPAANQENVNRNLQTLVRLMNQHLAPLIIFTITIFRKSTFIVKIQVFPTTRKFCLKEAHEMAQRSMPIGRMMYSRMYSTPRFRRLRPPFPCSVLIAGVPSARNPA